MKVHEFTAHELGRYKKLDELYGKENPHFRHVIDAANGWQEREGLLVCWYCGSLKPSDLLPLFDSGKVVSWSGSDWKYGWPHKFYIEVDSGKPAVYYYEINGERVDKDEWDKANADRDYRTNPLGGRSMGTGRERGTGVINAKFYTTHLADEESYSPSLLTLIQEKFGIAFQVVDGQLKYSAIVHGYQSSGSLLQRKAS